MSLPRVLVCNAGTIHVFQLAKELNRHDLLAMCATSLYFKRDTFTRFSTDLSRWAEAATVNRRCDELEGKVKTFSSPELVRLLASKTRIGNAAELIVWRNRKFGLWVAQNCLDNIDLVWSFDTSSMEIFEAAKKRNIACILDVTIAHPRLGKGILKLHSERRPEYKVDLDDGVSDAQMTRRVREIELADCVLAGSSFVAESLESEKVPSSKITVIPYGVYLNMFARGERSYTGEPLIFLFVGWFSQRKGIYYLLEAWEQSRLWEQGARLHLAGGSRKDLRFWQGNLPEGVSILGRVPYDQLPKVYSDADVFVFPSLFEGFAKVLLEAMASGLPIITTPNACDKAAVIDGENGFMVEPGDVNGVSEAMKTLNSNALLCKSMSRKAVDASTGYSWSLYGERCREICLRVYKEHVESTRKN